MIGPVMLTSSCNIYFKSHRDARTSLIKLQWTDPDSGATIIAIEEISSVEYHTLYSGDTFNGQIIPVDVPISVYTASRNGLRQSEWSLPFVIQFTETAVPEIDSIVPGELTVDEGLEFVSFDDFEEYT